MCSYLEYVEATETDKRSTGTYIMADLYNLDAELEQGMLGTDDAHLVNTEISTDEDANHTDNSNNINAAMENDDTAYDDTSDYPSMSNVPVALREAAIERQRIRRGGDTNNDDNDYDDGTFNDNNKKGKDLWDKSNTESYLFDGMQQQQQEEEKRNYRIQLPKLPYTRLYQAWVQECRAPELLPYPYEMIQQIRDGMMRYENYSTMNEQQEDQGEGGDRHRHRRHTNENLNALMDSLLRIDAERVKFLLSDLLKRRIQKITLHPQYYTTLLLNDPKQQQLQQQQQPGDESNEDNDNKEDYPLMCRPEVMGRNYASHIFGGVNHDSNSFIFSFVPANY